MLLEPALGPRARERAAPAKRAVELESLPALVVGLALTARELVVVGGEAAREAEAPVEHEGADEGRGAVAVRGQRLGERRCGVREGDAVLEQPERARQEPGEQRRVRRQGGRHRRVRGREAHAVARDLLHARRRRTRVAVGRGVVGAQRVEGDDDDVRSSRCGGVGGRARASTRDDRDREQQARDRDAAHHRRAAIRERSRRRSVRPFRRCRPSAVGRRPARAAGTAASERAEPLSVVATVSRQVPFASWQHSGSGSIGWSSQEPTKQRPGGAGGGHGSVAAQRRRSRSRRGCSSP